MMGYFGITLLYSLFMIAFQCFMTENELLVINAMTPMTLAGLIKKNDS